MRIENDWVVYCKPNSQGAAFGYLFGNLNAEGLYPDFDYVATVNFGDDGSVADNHNALYI